MKSISLLLVFLILSFATSCTRLNSSAKLTNTPPQGTGNLSDTEAGEAVQIGQTVHGGKAVTTENEVRSMYKDDEGVTIEKITPYNQDFLVQYGPVGGPWWFDWVYGDSGTRRKLMLCYSGIRDVKIQGTGSIRVLTDGLSCINGYRSFPYIQTARVSIMLDVDGQPLPYKESYSESSRIETYWADINEASSFGMVDRIEAVINALVTVSGVEMAFGPRAGENGIADFAAAFCAPPETDIAFDVDSRMMTITCHNTSLKSGEPAFTAPLVKSDFEQWLKRAGNPFPTNFPAGKLDGSNPLIEQATIQENGGDTVVTLILTEKATEYTVEFGYTGPDDMGPYFRVILRERSIW